MYRSTLYNAKKIIDLMIPLDFWFTKDYSLALPLLAMTSQDISINFSFRNFEDLINYDGTIGTRPASVIDSYVYIEYIFLDETILNSFHKQKFTYVIEQMVYNGDENIPENQSIFQTQITLKNPCKELLFACIDQNNIDNNQYFNYSRRTDAEPLILEASLLLDGKHRFDNFLPEVVFRNYFPNNVHSVIPNKHLYTIPFCTNPDSSIQPTGSINLSRFDNVTLALNMNRGNPACQIHIYGIMLNIVTIENGILRFEFVNV